MSSDGSRDNSQWRPTRTHAGEALADMIEHRSAQRRVLEGIGAAFPEEVQRWSAEQVRSASVEDLTLKARRDVVGGVRARLDGPRTSYANGTTSTGGSNGRPERRARHQTSAIRVEAKMSSDITINRGKRKGCVLSPFLINLYLELIFRVLLDEVNEGIKVNG